MRTTALETLTASDPDVAGLRVRAQLETKAALELLERSEGALSASGEARALEHTRRAAQSLRVALAAR